MRIFFCLCAKADHVPCSYQQASKKKQVSDHGAYPIFFALITDFFVLLPRRAGAAHNAPDKNKIKNDGAYAPGGTRTPDPGLIRPMLYQTELPELCCPRSGSNQGPSDLQSDALPTELHGRTESYLPRNQCEIEPTIEKTIVAIKSFLRAPAGNWTRI